MSEAFHLAAFLARWHSVTHHDLSASYSETVCLSTLLALATQELTGWERLRLDYTASRGAVALRGLIAPRHNGLDADDVVCCAGAQEGVACVARALLAPGDHAIVVVPI